METAKASTAEAAKTAAGEAAVETAQTAQTAMEAAKAAAERNRLLGADRKARRRNAGEQRAGQPLSAPIFAGMTRRTRD